MSQQTINLKEKNLVELKALSYDLQAIVQQYSQMLQTVSQEISLRLEEENKAKQESTLQEAAKQVATKGKKSLSAVKD